MVRWQWRRPQRPLAPSPNYTSGPQPNLEQPAPTSSAQRNLASKLEPATVQRSAAQRSAAHPISSLMPI